MTRKHYQRIAVTLIFTFACCLSTAGQKKEEPDDLLKAVLYANSVVYETYACGTEYKSQVTSYFNTRPLKNNRPICHNDCPIISCRPVIYFPAVARAAHAVGTVRVHVLVDEKGKVLYARYLTGNTTLRDAAVQGACKTQFQPYPFGKHQGIMEFTVDNYDYLTVPFTANRVP